MQKNVGTIDSYIRIAAGLTMLGYGISKSSCILMGLGAIKVAEGVTRWCPMLHMLGLCTLDDQKLFEKQIEQNLSPQ